MPTSPNPWRRLVYASHTMPLEFYTLLFLPIFGIFGLIFGSVLDDPRWSYTWVAIFVLVIKIMLIFGPLLTLFAISIRALYLATVGMALTGLNCLAYSSVAFVLLFPNGGGFVIGGFLGLGVGYIRQVLNVAQLGRDFSEIDSPDDMGG